MKRNFHLFIFLTIICVCLSSQNNNLEKETHKGKVTATMNAGGYTYIEFLENEKKLWVASNDCQVEVGNTIEFSQAALMANFYSKTLDRTFELIRFVGLVTVEGAKTANEDSKTLPAGHIPLNSMDQTPPSGHPPVASETKTLPSGHMPMNPPAPTTPKIAPGSIKKAENGLTVAECFAQKETLNGKPVKIRGKVVKFNEKILGRNWVHIQDGTGEEEDGSDDLTITTNQNVTVGTLVVVNGKLSYEKELPEGRIYHVMVESAAITVEKK